METPSLLQLIVSIGPVIGVIIMQWKSNVSNKKDNKIIMDSIKETYSQSQRSHEILTEHIETSVFNTELHGVVQARSTNVIRLSKLDPRHKSVMKFASKSLEDLAFKYYYYKNRKVEHERIDFVDEEVTDIETNIKIFVKRAIQDFKTIKYSTGRYEVISFYDFIFDENNKNPFKNLRILKVSLEENGFGTEDGPDFIEIMDKFTKLILVAYTDDVKAWNDVEDHTEKKGNQHEH